MANYFTKAHHFALTAPAADTASGLAKGDIIGFTCIPDPQTKAPFYKELDGQYLVDLFYNSQADQTAKNPQEELPIILSDYRSGFGMDIQDYNYTKRYFSSCGVDLRFKDRAILSYGPSPLTYPTDVVYNADMEDNRDWTNGAQSGVQKQAGSYSWAVTTGAADATQSLPWSDTYKSCEFTFTAYLWASGVAGVGARIGIFDGVDYTWSTKNDGDSDWDNETVSKTLAATASELTLVFDNESGATAYMDTVTITGTTVHTLLEDRSTKAFCDFGGHIYVAVGRDLCKIDGSTGAFTWVKDMPVTITDLEPMTIGGTDSLFIAQGLANPYHYMTGSAFAESNAVNPNYQYFEVVYTTAATMYGNDTNSTIRSTINPLNGGTAWSDVTQIDNDAWDILDLSSKSGALYIRKEDKPYYLNSSGGVENDLAPETLTLAANTQDRAWIIWNNENFYACGTSSFIRIGTTNEWISPSDYCTNQSAFTGRIFAVAADNRYIFIATDDGASVEIMCGRDEEVDDDTSWVWHPYQKITMTGVEVMHTTSIYRKRLYIASDTAGESIQYIPLPVSYGNIEGDTYRNFPISATAYYFETPYLHGRFKADTKGWIKVTSTLGHDYDAAIYWTIQYKKLQDSSYTNIGNLVGTATDRTHTLYLPVDASSNNPVSTMMRFKLIGVTDDTDKTPILLNLDIRAVLYPARKDIIWAKVKVAKEMVTMGGKQVDKYAKTKACLEKCRDATYPIAMTDMDGNSTQVRFMELPQSLPWKDPMTDEAKRDRDYVFNCLMLKTPTS